MFYSQTHFTIFQNRGGCPNICIHGTTIIIRCPESVPLFLKLGTRKHQGKGTDEGGPSSHGTQIVKGEPNYFLFQSQDKLVRQIQGSMELLLSMGNQNGTTSKNAFSTQILCNDMDFIRHKIIVYFSANFRTPLAKILYASLCKEHLKFSSKTYPDKDNVEGTCTLL